MNGLNPTFLSDPVAAAHEPIAAKVKALGWREFEELVAALLSEVGFVDVQRLTVGSQQGKDIVATWPSRFCLGAATRFRVQVKHKREREHLTKPEIGDSIADFISQRGDEILLIVTNGKLANDLIDQIDRLLEQGFRIHSLAGNRFIRFLAALGRTNRGLIDLADVEREALHHTFEVRDWFEQICKPKCARFSFWRYWTEPYTWFFYKDLDGKIRREWTTSGGEFRLSCFNPSEEVERIGRIVLKVTGRENLPGFGIINSTPKGGHNIHRVTVELTRNLGDFVLNDESKQCLPAGGCFSCLVDFKPVDPGIYHFRIYAEGTGGSQTVRESEEFTIVSMGAVDVWQGCREYISVREGWPRGMAVVEALLNLPSESIERILSKGVPVSAWLDVVGDQLQVSLQCCSGERKSEEVARLRLQSPDAELLMQLCDRGIMRRSRLQLLQVADLFEARSWYEEKTDPTEPRGIAGRAFKLLKAGRSNHEIMETLEKAHERLPQRARSAADYACICYQIGYQGFALFYLTTAYYNAPYVPTVAGLFYGLLSKLCKPLPAEEMMTSAFSSPDAEMDFQRIRAYVLAHKSFPICYGEAELAPFEQDDDFAERKMNERW